MEIWFLRNVLKKVAVQQKHIRLLSGISIPPITEKN